MSKKFLEIIDKDKIKFKYVLNNKVIKYVNNI